MSKRDERAADLAAAYDDVTLAGMYADLEAKAAALVEALHAMQAIAGMSRQFRFPDYWQANFAGIETRAHEARRRRVSAGDVVVGVPPAIFMSQRFQSRAGAGTAEELIAGQPDDVLAFGLKCVQAALVAMVPK